MKKKSPITGKLVALGGGSDDNLLLLIKSELCSTRSRIEIIPTATTDSSRTGEAYVKAFKELGCTNANFLLIDETHPADQPENIKRIRDAQVVFFTGGDQNRLTTYLNGTEVMSVLMQRLQDDELVIAGTSAGAMAMSNVMIFEGSGPDAMLKDQIQTTGGLNLIKNLYLDTHFTERGRFGRLAQAVARQPSCIGVGLGEATGILISEGSEIEVFGPGIVTIMDPSTVKYTNLAEANPGEPIAIEHLVVHFLVEGQKFSIEQHLFRAKIKQVQADVTALKEMDEAAKSRIASTKASKKVNGKASLSKAAKEKNAAVVAKGKAAIKKSQS